MTEDEIKSFIEKYQVFIHPSKRNKSIEENAHEIYEDTKGHPIMVRFSVLQDGLRTHIIQMYTDYLVQNNSPNTERIKSVIVCSLYDISSIPLTEEELYNKLDLKKSSLQIINTIIKRTGNVWTTIHPRWDLELFKYMFSLNDADREEIQDIFGFVLTKILEVQRGSFDQILVLNTVYNTIAVERFIDIKFIQKMIKVDDIEKKLDNPFFKLLFFANIVGSAFNNLKDHEEAIACSNKVIEIDPQYADAYYNKGTALSALGRSEEAIVCYDKAIEINPQHTNAYGNKGLALSALGRKEEAIEYYDQTIEINPQHTNAILTKTLSYSHLYEEAMDSFTTILE